MQSANGQPLRAYSPNINNMNHHCTFILLLASFGMLFTACKKDDTKPNKSIKLEQLGDFEPSPYSSVKFNFAGNPIIQSEDVIYEWSPTDQNWKKLADVFPEPNGFGFLLQDKQGEYYGRTSSSLFKLDKATLQWDTLRLGNYTTSATAPLMLTNELGDIVVRISDDQNFYYFKTLADESAWTKFKEQSIALEGDAMPYFLTNSGIIYYSSIFLGYPFGRLTDKTLNSNSGAFGKLFVKSELEQAGIQVDYNLDNHNDPITSINADGKVYILNHVTADSKTCTLYSLTPPAIPAPLVTEQVLTVSTVPEPKNEWTTTVSKMFFTVDDHDNLKLMLFNTKLDQSESYWTAATAKIGSPAIYSDGKELHQHELFQNLKGETYLLFLFGYFYKWE